jgi:Ca2+-binding RTX toxin-like protein
VNPTSNSRTGTFADTLQGDDGIDILIGNGGRDLLQGFAGADQMNGGGGNDTLMADADDLTGSPVLVGGAGSGA